MVNAVDDRLGVVAAAVEAAVDRALNALRSGLKSAAAARVEAATATGDENGNTSVATATIPMNTATSSPVRIAYEIVRLSNVDLVEAVL